MGVAAAGAICLCGVGLGRVADVVVKDPGYQGQVYGPAIYECRQQVCGAIVAGDPAVAMRSWRTHPDGTGGE